MGSNDLSQYQSPLHEYREFDFMQPNKHNELLTYYTQSIPQPAPPDHQQLLPLIMPGHPTWPSMLTNPASDSKLPPVAISRALPPLVEGNSTKLPAIHATVSPRKTLTDSDRRRMCQYHEENPTARQTEIGAMFGVERSTVSKVLRQREKYLFPGDRILSPVKRTKGKIPDIDRALSNWVRNMQKQGHPLTDAAIKEKAKFFATTVGSNSESLLKTNSTIWLEKFKQKNGTGGAKLTRRASETNMSNSELLHPVLAGMSASHTPPIASPTPIGLLSPLPTVPEIPITVLQPPEPSASNPALDDAQNALDTFINLYVANYRLSDQNFQHHYEVLLELREQLQRQKKFVQ